MRKNESYEGRIGRKLQKKTKIINVANGNNPADLVLKNASFVNVFTNDIRRGDIAICEGVIVGIGAYRGIREIDVSDSFSFISLSCSSVSAARTIETHRANEITSSISANTSMTRSA